MVFRLLKCNNHSAIRLFAFGMGLNVGVILKGGVHNAALVGVHGLEDYAAAALFGAVGHAQGELSEGFFSMLIIT